MHNWRKKLFYIIGVHKSRFFTSLFFGLLLNGFVSAVNPLSLKYLFDEGIIRQNFQRFALFALASILLFTLWRGGTLYYALSLQKLKTRILASLSLKLVETYYQLPYKSVLEQENGYFISRVYDEVRTTALPIIDNFLGLLNSLVSLLVALWIVSYISWRATIVLLITTPIIYRLSHHFGNKIKTESKQEQEQEAQLRGVLGRALAAYKTAKVFQLQETVLAKIMHQLNHFTTAFYIRYKTGAIYQTLSGMLMSLIETAVIIGAGYEMLNNRMTFGGFMGFMNAFWIVLGSSREIFDLLPEFSRTSAAIERLMEFQEPILPSAKITHTPYLHLKKIDFAYKTSSIIENFELKVERGKRILILGGNGSGKTTLANLIAGLLPPTQGEVFTFELSKISAVILPYEFIPGCMEDNINFLPNMQRNKRFLALAKELGLTEPLEKDPQEFSAGQKRKLAIIMGLLKEAELYIFDEPLSNIDTHSKKKIMDAIFRETAGKTLVIIMHGDEEYYSNFDQIITLRENNLFTNLTQKEVA